MSKTLVPYGDRRFSETRLFEFVSYLRKEINIAKHDYNKLSIIIHNLYLTLKALNCGKPEVLAMERIHVFISMFKGTMFDGLLADKYLKDTVASCLSKRIANSSKEYRQATIALRKNVKMAIGIGTSKFMTWPIKSSVTNRSYIVVGTDSINQDVVIHNNKYRLGAVKVNGIILPVLPIDFSLCERRCLRQWVRYIVSQIYNVNIADDIALYIALAVVLIVTKSDVDDDIKNAFRKLGLCMLEKKHYNSNLTELEWLSNGGLPIPRDGRIETFLSTLDRLQRLFDLSISRMQLWYFLCDALQHRGLSKGQRQHYLPVSTGVTWPKSYIAIPLYSRFDYTCIITFEDLSHVGGYRTLLHSFLGKNRDDFCVPTWLISERAFESMKNAGELMCPGCFRILNAQDFDYIGPKKQIKAMHVFEGSDINFLAAKSSMD